MRHRFNPFTRMIAALVLVAGATSAPAADAAPLAPEACLELRDALETSLDLRPAFFITEEVEADLRPLAQTVACRLQLKMTGVLFDRGARSGYLAAEQAFRDGLRDAGWVEAARAAEFAADGPLATRFAVEKDGALCVALVEVTALTREGAEDPNAPSTAVDGLFASQRRYLLEANCVTLE